MSENRGLITEDGSEKREARIENSGPRITARESQIINHRSAIKDSETDLSTLNSESFREQASQPSTSLCVSLLTGGGDKPYALGLAEALAVEGILVDFIGSNDLDVPELRTKPQIRFLNLRGDQRPDVTPMVKAVRVARYYVRLIRYAATARPKIFHILWNNKFEFFDRSLLMLYYRLLGKKILFTAHNVNAGKRDSNDSRLNRLSLKVQYALCDHIFVHTDAMKAELVADFGVSEKAVSVIPFGINNTVPRTGLSTAEAKRRLELDPRDKTMLFFGNIAPYKGLEYLVAAFARLASHCKDYRLIIAGRVKESERYWAELQQTLQCNGMRNRVIEKIEYIPDEEIELYFKAADLLVLPYIHIFQSGVLFLGYSFGLPAIASDVASLKAEIVEGKTGFVFKPQDSSDLATKIDQYFNSELYRNLEWKRQGIVDYVNERYSWTKIAEMTRRVYSNLLTSNV